MLFFRFGDSGIKRTLSGAAIAVAVAVIFGSPQASAKWAFTQQPADERARACQEQVSFCYNACGSVARTAVNFCSIQTTGWNCACNSGGGERRVRSYEWPMSVSECRAALKICNDGCTSNTSANERGSCYTSCTTDYQCNTNEAPRSSLRVNSAYDKPKGYIPPVDEKDIELTIGMKFGDSESDQGRKTRHAGDPGALPKTIPKSDDTESADGGSLGKGHPDIGGSNGHTTIYSGKRKGGVGQSGGSDVKAAASVANHIQMIQHIIAHAISICICIVLVTSTVAL
ncbi:hypothetical protein IW140_002835 [Coemansia sp. RSA 1813]|nr:hypothetical protein EV178_002755 [Coemansia sp. RSA 1646]KAJ1770113.1 hypothetical protein LPJ74_003474 [Coemansia sp. RSA 1843]KAJ2089848.1 hypothetical protein IW138_003142 [Coemansia sp. RSA 986]KAJ2214767.1 hypothetical protein EV179_002715 [Coemansia sp. RSA 487]KAJ2569754.1 hypothetical protein IW140_002835 [Coemansia sp. RSA 1813]